MDPKYKFIVLGCDGIYEKINNDELIKFIADRL